MANQPVGSGPRAPRLMLLATGGAIVGAAVAWALTLSLSAPTAPLAEALQSATDPAQRLNAGVASALAARGFDDAKVHVFKADFGVASGSAAGLVLARPPAEPGALRANAPDLFAWQTTCTADGAVTSLSVTNLDQATPDAHERLLATDADTALVVLTDAENRVLTARRWRLVKRSWRWHSALVWDAEGPRLAGGGLDGDRAWLTTLQGETLSIEGTDVPPEGARRFHPIPPSGAREAVADADWQVPLDGLRLRLDAGSAAMGDDGRPPPLAAPESDPSGQRIPAPAAFAEGGLIAGGRVLRAPIRGRPTLAVDAAGRLVFGRWDEPAEPAHWQSLRQGPLPAEDTTDGPAAGLGWQPADQNRPAALRGVTVGAGGTAAARARLLAAGVAAPHLVYPLGDAKGEADDRWWALRTAHAQSATGGVAMAEDPEAPPVLHLYREAEGRRWRAEPCRARWRRGAPGPDTVLSLRPDPTGVAAQATARGLAFAVDDRGRGRWPSALSAGTAALQGLLVVDQGAAVGLLDGADAVEPAAPSSANEVWGDLVVGTDASGRWQVLWAPAGRTARQWADAGLAAGLDRALWVDHDGRRARRWAVASGGEAESGTKMAEGRENEAALRPEVEAAEGNAGVENLAVEGFAGLAENAEISIEAGPRPESAVRADRFGADFAPLVRFCD